MCSAEQQPAGVTFGDVVRASRTGVARLEIIYTKQQHRQPIGTDELRAILARSVCLSGGRLAGRRFRSAPYTVRSLDKP